MGDDRRAGAAADDGRLALPSSPRSVAAARRYVTSQCARLDWAGDVDTVALLVSEITTNAILHAYGPGIWLRVTLSASALRVEVFDGSPVLPRPRNAPSRDENGRGLAMVDALAVRWGVDPRPDGKTFWFEI